MWRVLEVQRSGYGCSKSWVRQVAHTTKSKRSSLFLVKILFPFFEKKCKKLLALFQIWDRGIVEHHLNMYREWRMKCRVNAVE